MNLFHYVIPQRPFEEENTEGSNGETVVWKTPASSFNVEVIQKLELNIGIWLKKSVYLSRPVAQK